MGRLRRRRGRNNRNVREVRSVIANQKIDGGLPFTGYHIPVENPTSLPGIKFRNSERVGLTENSECFYRSLPYVTVSGKFSTYKICTWKTTLTKAYNSLVATIFARISLLLRKRHIRFTHNVTKLILSVSVVYALFHDDWLIDRFLGIYTKTSRFKDAIRLNTWYVCKLDDTERFVHHQICQKQVNWYTFQAERPSDKSSKKWDGIGPCSYKRAGPVLSHDDNLVCALLRSALELTVTTNIRGRHTGPSPNLHSCLRDGAFLSEPQSIREKRELALFFDDDEW